MHMLLTFLLLLLCTLLLRYKRFEQKIFIYSPPPSYCTEHYKLRGFHAENDLRSYALTAATLAAAEHGGTFYPEGDLFHFSDVDEIPRMQTLQLLKVCDFGRRIHLALDSYRYSFEHRLWPEIVFRSTVSVIGRIRSDLITHRFVKAGLFILQELLSIAYLLGVRFTYETNLLLGDAGWHCSWCFRTAEEVIFKMRGYSHSDRIESPRMLDKKSIERKFCTGQDPFEMLPEATSYSALVALTYPVRMQGVSHVPHYVAKHVERFRYLLPGGCRSRSRDQLNSNSTGS